MIGVNLILFASCLALPRGSALLPLAGFVVVWPLRTLLGCSVISLFVLIALPRSFFAVAPTSSSSRRLRSARRATFGLLLFGLCVIQKAAQTGMVAHVQHVLVYDGDWSVLYMSAHQTSTNDTKSKHCRTAAVFYREAHPP